MNPKRTDGSTRRVMHALFVPAFTLVIAASTPCAVAQPAVAGQWLDPVDCWPDKTMHTLHVPITVMIEGSPVKVARLLQWNSSGCPSFQGTIAAHCSTQTVGIVIPPCSAYQFICHPPPSLAQPWPSRLWNPMPASGVLCPDPLDLCPDAITYLTGYFQSWPGGVNCDALNDCNGHTAMSDGRVIVIGGGCGPVNADRDVFIFDPALVGTPQSPGTPWTKKADMISARWYPTALIAPNGKVASFGGQIGAVFVQQPEVYNPVTDSWQQLPAPGGSATIFSYPFMFLLHDGRILWAGHGNHTGTIDLTQPLPTWTPLTPHSGGGGGPFNMYSGSAVTYAPGKILKCGGLNGVDVATRTTAMIDFTASGTWTTNPLQSQMVHARADHNLVLLPTGHILAVGGRGACESPCPPQTPPLPCNFPPVMAAEWFDPNDPSLQWTELAAMTIPRGYHSTAVLLPDATVLLTGGEDWFLCPPNCNPATGLAWPSSRSAQIYKPPYLFQGPRPVITTAPSTLTCCTSFSVTLAGAVVPNNVKVNLIRPGMPSHGFDQNQRLVPLVVSGGTTPTTTLTVSAPVNLNHAPPGDYMLFVVHNGVPSVATYVRVVACLGNLDDCCFINGADLAILLGQWGTPGCGGAIVCSGDLNNDGNVDGTDLALLLGNWGACPGGGTSDTCGAAASGGGEAATAGGPSAPGSTDCGGGIDLFQHWLDTGDMAAFMQWLDCTLGLPGAGGGGQTQ